MQNDTSLIRMVIADLAEKNKWSYDETMERFYKSNTCRLLSDSSTGMFTFAPREIIYFFEEENASEPLFSRSN